VGRDLPYAVGLFRPPPSLLTWPEPPDDPVTLPASVPDDWVRPKPPDRSGDPRLEAAKLLSRKSEPDDRFRPFVVLAERDKAGNWIATKRLEGKLRGVRHVVVVKKTGRGDSTWRVRMAVDGGSKHVAAFGVSVPLEMSEHRTAHHLQAPGAFRVEHWRVDSNDEAIPGWLNSDRRTRWPIWRGGGILLGPANAYRIYKLNRASTSPLFVDEGFGSPGWFDVTDRGGEAHHGASVRLLRGAPGGGGAWSALTYDADARALRVAFVSTAGAPVLGPQAGGAEIVLHDGWRPAYARAPLTRAQYLRMLDDLDYAENIGLFALRFLLSETHKVGEGEWERRLADRGVTARQLLQSMTWRGALERHCRRIGVRYDAKRIDRTVTRIIEHYARRR
jgi:hypothetical protein